MAGVNPLTGFRDGYLSQGAPLGMLAQTLTLTADNTQVTMANFSLLLLSSDSTTAANRTFTLVPSPLIGQRIVIVFVSGSSTTAQLATSTYVKLRATWEPTQYDCIELVSDGSLWTEVGRELDSPADITLADGDILVGDATDVAAAVTLSGDATMTNAGVLTIANNAVTTAKILAANVTLAKLASGITPSHVVKYAANHTTAGGSATEAITVSGVAATDLVFAQIKTVGGTPRTIVSAAPTTNTVTIVFSGDPSTDHVVAYQVLRAAT